MRRLGRGAAVLVAGAVVVGGGIAAYAGDADPDLRTATVTRGEVQQALELTGTLSREGRADLVFPTAGTVAELPLAVGDQVEAGDVVARLKTRELRDEVRRARSRLASARAQLEADLEAQTAAVSTAVSTAASSGSSGGSSTGSGAAVPSSGTSTSAADTGDGPGAPADDDDDTQAVLATLAAQQQAVLEAQSSATTAIAAAKAALADQQTVCAAALEPAEEGGEDAASDTGEEAAEAPGDEATDDPGDDVDDGSVALDACTAALGLVQNAQDEVALRQDALQSALETLAATLSEVLGSIEGGSTTDPAPTDPASTDAPSNGGAGSQQSGQQPDQQSGQQSEQQSEQQSGTAASGAGAATDPDARAGTLTVTASTLAQDQASIEEARAGLVQARDALAMATVRAPISGSVVALDVAEGDSVAAGVSVGVVVSEGSTVLTATVALADVPSLEPGQRATVSVAGGDEELEAEVTQIGTVPDDTGAYPVTLELRRTDLDLPTDLPATASVVVGEASDALVVPGSAVGDGTATLVDASGATSTTRVTTGLVGATTVEVVDGLEEGQEVVLADLGEPLPGADDTQVGPGAGSGGGFGGGGPPAGFTGGGAGGRFPGAGR